MQTITWCFSKRRIVLRRMLLLVRGLGVGMIVQSHLNMVLGVWEKIMSGIYNMICLEAVLNNT